MNPRELEGRVVVVTGASSGLGAAYARALAHEGAKVVLCARREAPLNELAADLPAAEVLVGDISEPATATGLVETACGAYGRIDVLVNNAGTLRDRTLAKMSLEAFDDVIRSHVYGAFLATRAVVPVMREQGSGAVVNVGSDSGLRGAFGQTNYAAAKAALAAMTLSWARELRRHEISCNCVLPNAYTAMTAGLDEVLAEYRYGPPEAFPRAMGEPDEVAPLIVWLASERASKVNGLILGLGGDKLSLWEPARERAWAFKQGGWSLDDVDRWAGEVFRGDPSCGPAPNIDNVPTGVD